MRDASVPWLWAAAQCTQKLAIIAACRPSAWCTRFVTMIGEVVGA